MKTFVQFYDYEDYNNILWLHNSYSSVWKVIKDLGDIIWIDPHKDYFPDIESGTVYISCTFEYEVLYSEKWIGLRPDLQFIIGGPSIDYSGYNITATNLNLEKRTMYELLDITPIEELWGLDVPEIPNELPYNVSIGYTYALSYGHRCYWGKCVFCKTNLRKELIVDVKKIPEINTDKKRGVWLNTQAITPKNITTLFPTFNREMFYSFYVRGDNVIKSALNKVEINNNLMPVLGVEFPSDRMLTLMNKGTDLETMIDVILSFASAGNLTILTTINGWNCLEESDLSSLKYFLSKLAPYKNNIICINHWLFNYEKKKNMVLKKTKYNKPYYVYLLDANQENLNNRALEIYNNFGFKSYKSHLESKPMGKVNPYGLD